MHICGPSRVFDIECSAPFAEVSLLPGQWYIDKGPAGEGGGVSFEMKCRQPAAFAKMMRPAAIN
jgi:hypothetical protein